MKRYVDHPHVRASGLCPLCGGAKSLGAVTCWLCHNDCEHGTPGRRAMREEILDIIENRLKAEDQL